MYAKWKNSAIYSQDTEYAEGSGAMLLRILEKNTQSISQ